MLEYITRDEYVGLLGEGMPNNITKLIREASNYINYHTHNRINPNKVSDTVKYVTCLIVSLIKEEETKLSEIGSLKSQNIEGWSESYSTPEEIKKEYMVRKYDILKMYLTNEIGIDGLPLLYCGVG